jgi:hypothetical protein
MFGVAMYADDSYCAADSTSAGPKGKRNTA